MSTDDRHDVTWPKRPLSADEYAAVTHDQALERGGLSARDLMALTVLAFLTEGPHHAYDIERMIRERHKDFAAGQLRTLYHAVGRLARTGLIEPVETTREGKRPERTVFRITEAGRDKFAGWLRDLLENPAAEHPQLTVAISFVSYLPQGQVLDALRARTVALEATLAGLSAASKVLTTEIGLPRLFLLEHECNRALRQAELDWIRSLIRDISSGELSWDPREPWAGQPMPPRYATEEEPL